MIPFVWSEKVPFWPFCYKELSSTSQRYSQLPAQHYFRDQPQPPTYPTDKLLKIALVLGRALLLLWNES